MKAQHNAISRIRAVVGGVTILLLCAGVILYYFLNNRIIEVNRLNSELAVLEQASDQSLTVRSIVQTTKTMREKLSMYFITKATVGSFIGELETYAERAGVVLALGTPSVEKDKQISSDKFLKFSVRTEGEFGRIFHFLELVESMPYKIKISTIKIGKLDLDDVKSKIWFEEITFNLISYIDK